MTKPNIDTTDIPLFFRKRRIKNMVINEFVEIVKSGAEVVFENMSVREAELDSSAMEKGCDPGSDGDHYEAFRLAALAAGKTMMGVNKVAGDMPLIRFDMMRGIPVPGALEDYVPALIESMLEMIQGSPDDTLRRYMGDNQIKEMDYTRVESFSDFPRGVKSLFRAFEDEFYFEYSAYLRTWIPRLAQLPEPDNTTNGWMMIRFHLTEDYVLSARASITAEDLNEHSGLIMTMTAMLARLIAHFGSISRLGDVTLKVFNVDGMERDKEILNAFSDFDLKPMTMDINGDIECYDQLQGNDITVS